VTLQSFEHGGLGPTKAQKDVGKLVVGQELRMNVKKCVFGDWLQLIIFSDESRFCLWQSDGRLRVRRPRGQRLNLQFTLRRHSGLTPGITVWGAIQFGSRSPLVFIQGSLNAEPVLLPCTVFFSKTTLGYTLQE
jgi:hypothetical protein